MKKNWFDALVQQLNKPSLKQKVNFFRLLSVSQNAGLGIRESIVSIKKSETHKGFREILEELIISLTEGASLAEALENHGYFFNSDEIELVRSAQITGNMTNVLAQIADELENTQEVSQKISKAMTYPTMVLLMAIWAVIVILVHVMPGIVGMFGDNKLPEITQFMMAVSHFLQEKRAILLGILVIIVAGYKLLYHKLLLFKIFMDRLFITTPVIRDVVKTFYMYRFSSLLSQFYEAGVSPVTSLKLLGGIFDNFHYKKKMMDVKSDLEAGFTLYESLAASTLFDPILVQIINVGENTWSLTNVLGKMSNFYRNTFKNSIDVAMSMIEPILMMFVATIVGTIVASIFLPMASMMEVVQRL